MGAVIHERLLLWWGSRHIGEIIRRRALYRALRPLLRDGMRILDVGCGRGDIVLWIARRYPGVRVDAVDINPKLVEIVRCRSEDAGLTNVHVQQSDIERLSFVTHPSPLCGIVYGVDVLEHLAHPELALQQIVSLLEGGGYCILHVPHAQQRRWLRRFDGYKQRDHEREGFDPEELVALLRASGLKALEVRHTFGPSGALAWELFRLASGVGKWFALLTYPIPRILAWADGRFLWKRGNGLLVVAKKDDYF